MREVAKSMLGFSWAVSMFGIQQAGKLLGGAAQTAERTAAEIDDVSRAVQSHLSGSSATRFRSGDQWQRRIIDTVFDVGARAARPQQVVSALDPRSLLRSADARSLVEKSVNVFSKSVDGVKQSVDNLTRSITPSGGDASPVVSANTPTV